jgi:hypothetical protein
MTGGRTRIPGIPGIPGIPAGIIVQIVLESF